MRGTILAILLGFSMISPAAAQLRIVQESGARVRSGPATSRIGIPVRLGLRLGRRSLPAGTEVHWLRIVPRLQHEATPPPNEGDPTYSNAVLMGPDHGQWLGFDAIEYETHPLPDEPWAERRGADLVLHGAPAPERRGRAPRRSQPLVGTMWVAAEARLPDGRVVRTADADDTDRLGLHRNVQRVSFRASDDFIGWLGSYFDVPYVFGSTPRQSERYVGIDCADVLVGARRRETGRELRYTSVSGIDRLAEDVSEVLLLGEDRVLRDVEGEAVAMRWGTDVRPGDMLAIDYADDDEGLLPRAWDHIGALLSDSGPDGRADGVLGGDDLLRHMGRRGLTDEALWRHGPIRIRVWRWDR